MNKSTFNNIYIETRYVDTLEKFVAFLNHNTHLGLTRVHDPLESDIAIYFDLVDSDSISVIRNLSLTKVLVRQEPKMIIPKNYDKRLVDVFDHVIDIGKFQQDVVSNINWPQDLFHNYSNFSTRKNVFVMINSNLLSLFHGQNYTLRREIAAKIPSIHLYGFQWNNNFFAKSLTLGRELMKYLPRIQQIELSGLRYYFRTFHNYFGTVVDKRKVMSMYKYSIVIENSSDYISEKLFDSFLSGCIPVYVGVDLSQYNLPESLYIQAEPNLADVKRKMVIAQQMNYTEWVINLNDWLISEQTHKEWSSEFFFQKILTSITTART